MEQYCGTAHTLKTDLSSTPVNNVKVVNQQPMLNVNMRTHRRLACIHVFYMLYHVMII